MSNLPAGYKQTEVGVIPEDWELKRLGEIVEKFVNGGTPSTKNEALWNGNIPWITGADILNQKVTEIRRHITTDAVKNSSTNVISKGNLLLVSRTGVGKLAIAPFDIAISQDFTGIYPKKESLLAEYLFRFFDFNQSLLKSQNQGTSIQGVTRETLSALSIPLPTKAEQTAIAAALSDADALIQSMEKLIAKKRLIKQGAMQELLTGKKRLAGFEGDWQEYELNELGIFKGGSGFPTKYQGLIEGKFPFYKVSDMNIEGNEVFMSNSNNYITEDIKKLTNTVVFPKNTIVFAKIGAAVFLERKKILTQESCIDNNMMGFILNATKCDINFFHSLFLSFKLSKLVSTTALPSLNGKEIGQLKIKIPKPEEQTAIATILSDMDAEISALETKLAKYKQVKQGMMQNLLTGKIRLV
ncbi:MAG: restriction endonuclease subunit S [Desulfobacterales bacterium]|nr:restriction endonuclease subunit S [Desulfobacterales bacterium]